MPEVILGFREVVFVSLQSSVLVEGVDEPYLVLSVLGIGGDELLEEPFGLIEQWPGLSVFLPVERENRRVDHRESQMKFVLQVFRLPVQDLLRKLDGLTITRAGGGRVVAAPEYAAEPAVARGQQVAGSDAFRFALDPPRRQLVHGAELLLCLGQSLVLRLLHRPRRW